MPSYEVKLPATIGGHTLVDGHDVMFVEAATAADAIAVAAGHYDGDSSTAWATKAVATEAANPADLSPVTASGKTTSFKLWVRVSGGNGDAGADTYWEVTSAATDSYADAWAAMVIAINAHANFANAAFAANLLTVSNIGDDFGDHTLECAFEYGGQAVPSFVGAITHEGIEGAVLTVATNASVVLPKVLSTARVR